MIRNWIIYGFVVLLSTAFVMFYGDRVAFATLYAVLMLPLLSGIYAFVSKFYFKFTQKINSDFVLKGDEVIYTIVLNNKSIFSYSHVKVIFKENTGRVGLQTSIENKLIQITSKQSKKIKFSIVCPYRGMFEIGADCIEFKDMLGLFKYKLPINNKIKILVYPKIIEINNFPIPFLRMSKSQSNLDVAEEDYASISDIRKYQDSDNYKKIHWKLSAKKMELLVKNFQTSVTNSTSMFLDTSEVSLDIEDELVESVISLIDYCLKKNIPTQLHYFTDKHEIIKERSAEGFFNIYSACANLKFAGKNDLYGIFKDYILSLSDYTNIIVFTSFLSEILLNEMIEANNFGHNVILFSIADGTSTVMPSSIEKIKNSGIFCFEGSSRDLA